MSPPAPFVAVMLALAMPAPTAAPTDTLPLSTEQASGDATARARSLFQQGRLEEARELLEQRLQEAPEDGASLLLLGRVELAQGDIGAAEEHLERSVELGALPFMASYSLGMVRLAQQRHEEARELFSDTLRRAPGFSLPRIVRAQAEMFVGDLDAARADLAAARTGDSEVALAAIIEAELDLATGASEAALATFRALAAEADDRPAFSIALAYADVLGGGPAGAPARALVWAETDPYEPRAWFAAGVAFAAAGRREDALPLFRVALAVDDQHGPSYVALRSLLGAPAADQEPGSGAAGHRDLPPPYPGIDRAARRLRDALDNGNADEVDRLAGEILSQRPLHVPARLARLRAAELDGRLLDALAESTALDLALPDLPRLLGRQTALALRVGATARARDSIDRAIAAEPENAELHSLRASVLEASGELDDAISACRRAIELGDGRPAVYVLLGNLLYQRQQIPDAIAALQRAVELDPEAAEHIAAFALTALTTAERESVRRILQQYVGTRPGSVNSLYALATMQLRDGDLAEAEQALVRLTSLVPERSQVYYNLAQVYRRQGRDEAARQAMDTFARLKEEEDRLFSEHNEASRRRQQGRRALEEGRAAEAIEILTELVNGPLADHADLVDLATAYLQAGDAGSAHDWFERALAGSPYDAVALCGAAQAAEALGLSTEVESLLGRATLLGKPCAPERSP